jgi:hypothetical protein
VSRASYWRDRLRGFELGPLIHRGELTSRLEDIAIGRPYSHSGLLRPSTEITNIPIVESLDSPMIPQVLLGFFQDQASLALGTDLLLTRLRTLEISQEYSALEKLIQGRPVAHVRRGDYVTSSAARAAFGTLSPRYYHESMERLGLHIGDAVFFSDDVEYVEQEMGIRASSIVGPSMVKSSLQNLLLMSSGTALVMPNSTFSWWAAELLAGQGEVIAPKTWFFDRDDSLSPARAHWLRNENV